MIFEQSALDWIESWNGHDLDNIMQHYAEDIEFISPFVVKLFNSPDGQIQGKAQLREYFAAGLKKFPDLEFKLIRVFAGVNSFTIFYRSVSGLLAAEVMVLDSEGKIVRVYAHYSPE